MNSINNTILCLGILTTACGTKQRLSPQNSHEFESPFCIDIEDGTRKNICELIDVAIIEKKGEKLLGLMSNKTYKLGEEVRYDFKSNENRLQPIHFLSTRFYVDGEIWCQEYFREKDHLGFSISEYNAQINTYVLKSIDSNRRPDNPENFIQGSSSEICINQIDETGMELCKYSTENIRSLLKKAYESDCSIVANTPMINSHLGKINHNRFNIYCN